MLSQSHFNGITWWLLFAGPMVFVAFVSWAVYQWRISVRLRRFGIVTKAKITEFGKATWGRTLYFYARYEFYVDSKDAVGGRYIGGQVIGPSHFRRIQEGSEVTVSFIPTNPAIS